MADTPNPNGNAPLTGGDDKEKLIKILKDAGDKLGALSNNIDIANGKLKNFSDGFNKSAASVKLLNDELKTLQELTGKKFKINIPVVNTSTSSNGGGRGGNSGASSSSSGALKADNKEILEIERKLKEIENNLKRSQLSLDEQKKLIDYNRKRLYDEYNANQAKKLAAEAEEKKWSKAAADQEYKQHLYDSKVKKAQTAYEASKRNDYTSWWESELNKKDAADAAGYAEYKSRMEKEEAAGEALGVKARKESEAEYDNSVKGMLDYLNDKLFGSSPLGKSFKQISTKLLGKGEWKEGETVTDAVKGILAENPMLSQIMLINGGITAITWTINSLKSVVERISEDQKKSIKADVDYYNAARLTGASTEDYQSTYKNAKQATESMMRDELMRIANGDVVQGVLGFIKRVGNATNNAYMDMIGFDAKEPEAIRQKFLSGAMAPLIGEGTSFDSSKNMAQNLYMLGEKWAPQYLKYDEQIEDLRTYLPSEMAEIFKEAILGNSDALAEFGVIMNDKILEGYVSEEKKKDIVNVEVSESVKQEYRLQMLTDFLDILEKKGSKSLNDYIASLERTGEAMEHFKNQLFSFDEVITLNGYEPTHVGEIKEEEPNEILQILIDLKNKVEDTIRNGFKDLVGDSSSISEPVNDVIDVVDDDIIPTVEDLTEEVSELKDTVVKLDYGNLYDVILKAFIDGGDAAAERIRNAFIDGGDAAAERIRNALHDITVTVMIQAIGGTTSTGIPSGFAGSDVYTSLPSGTPDDNTKLYLNPIDTSAPASFLGYGPQNSESNKKEWGFAWGGPGSASDILIDVTGNNNYIGKRMSMTDSEARSWANSNYYRFGPDENGSTPARGVDIGNFYQPNSSSESSGSLIDDIGNILQQWESYVQNAFGVGDHSGGGHRFGNDILSQGWPSLSEIGSGALDVLGDITGISTLVDRVGAFQNSGSGIDFLGMLSGVANMTVPGWGLFDSSLFGDKETSYAPGNMGGGDSFTINMNLSGLNIAEDEDSWNNVANRLAERIDILRQRRGSLSYGSTVE